MIRLFASRSSARFLDRQVIEIAAYDLDYWFVDGICEERRER